MSVDVPGLGVRSLGSTAGSRPRLRQRARKHTIFARSNQGYRVTQNDIEWVAEHLKKHGDRAAW